MAEYPAFSVHLEKLIYRDNIYHEYIESSKTEITAAIKEVVIIQSLAAEVLQYQEVLLHYEWSMTSMVINGGLEKVTSNINYGVKLIDV